MSKNKIFTIPELIDSDPISISFEFFPPKTPEMEKSLWDAILKLEKLSPEFVSVTYGAGGSTRERTHNTVKKILKETSLTPAAHLTCVGASKQEIDDIAKNYWDMGVKHIVALRGDLPEGMEIKQDGYHYASDLVEGLKKVADFEISVACYPECHPEARSPEEDLTYLKKKIDAGANKAISQFFFDAETFLRFRDKAQKIGIDAPIIPGILPITNYSQTVKFAKMCGTCIPGWIDKLFSDADKNYTNLISAIVATEQCRILRSEGVEHFHFYTLNRAELTASICKILGVNP